jgi:xanthine/CO dehydrogenase XdhC/CoxF family maturation factor
MLASETRLHDFFRERRARGEPLVLATVVETEGSTYRKPGAQMLIADDGTAAGLLSGGCLEADLIERAQRVLRSGRAELATYDTRGSDDVLWGIGLGCEGAMSILLTRMDCASGYQPFAFIDAARNEHRHSAFALVIRGNNELPLGTAFEWRDGVLREFSGTHELQAPAPQTMPRHEHPAALPTTWQISIEDALVLVVPIALRLRVLILGAGPDVQPLARIAGLLGWQVTIADHRPAYAVAAHFPDAIRVVHSPAAEIASALDLTAFDAAVVMSHHLISDEAYLRALARTPVPYVGLLGPAPRRQRLLVKLGAEAQRLAGRLRGPAGLDIGANTPETIALAIASEIQAALSGRSGRPFTDTHG